MSRLWEMDSHAKAVRMVVRARLASVAVNELTLIFGLRYHSKLF